MTPFLFIAYKLVKYGLYPLTWITLSMGLTTVLAFLPTSPARIRWMRRSATLSLALLVVLSNPSVSVTLVGALETFSTSPAPPVDRRYDAIVVLGGGVHPKGTLRPAHELTAQSRERVACGAQLYAQHSAPWVLLAGGGAGIFDSAPAEAPEMKRLILRLGVPESAVRTEEMSRTTYENAVGVKQILGEASILLVTNAVHMPRAAALFEKQGLHVTPAPCGYLAGNRPHDVWWSITVPDLLPDSHSLELSTTAVTEAAGTVLYWLAGKI